MGEAICYPLYDSNGPIPIKAKVQSGEWTTSSLQLNSAAGEELFRGNSKELDLLGENTMGEKVVSIRQLLNRFECVYTDNQVAPRVFYPYSNVMGSRTANPARFRYLPADNTQRNIVSNRCSAYDWFSMCYAYMRGSLRLKIFPSDDAASASRWRCSLGVVDSIPFNGEPSRLVPERFTVLTGTAPGDFDLSTAAAECNMTKEGCIEIQIPYYGQFALSPTCNHVQGGQVGTFYQTYMSYVACSPTSGTGNYRVYRAVADDFSMGFLIGTPWVRLYDQTDPPPTK